MLFFNTNVAASPIHGQGLFTGEPIRRGQIVGLLGHHAEVAHGPEFTKLLEERDPIFEMSAVRWVGKYFLYGTSITNEEYINHSWQPSLLYHLGVVFAWRDLAPGDELTVDYRYFLSTHADEVFNDSTNGEPVTGYPGLVALKESTKALIALVESIPDWDDINQPRTPTLER